MADLKNLISSLREKLRDNKHLRNTETKLIISFIEDVQRKAEKEDEKISDVLKKAEEALTRYLERERRER